MTISVYSTLGTQETSINSNANSWEELKKELLKLGIYSNDMQTLIGEKNLREKYKENLPKEDFTLFIVPKKVKSGLGEDAWNQFVGKVNFNEDGMNYQKNIRNEWE